jgi:hypothetical protein
MQYFVTFLQNSSGSSGTFREMVGTLAKLGNWEVLMQNLDELL